MISSYGIEYSDDSNLVYFTIDLYELFKITNRATGIKSLLRKALSESRRRIPYRTGRMRSSYTMEYLGRNQVKVYFDPQIIVSGKVKDYYPKYLKEHPKTARWFDDVFISFYQTMLSGIEPVIEQYNIDQDVKATITYGYLFYSLLMKNYLEKYTDTNRRETTYA